MFTQSELTEAASLAVSSQLPLEIAKFEYPIAPYHCEESIEIYRGEKQYYRSALHFWVKFQQRNWGAQVEAFLKYINTCQCKPISEKEFTDLIAKRCESTPFPLPSYLRHPEGYRSGLIMSEEADDVSVLAELKDAYAAFFWTTTLFG